MNKYKTDLTVEEKELMNLADTMASCMANLNSQNYESFVEARELFRVRIGEISKKSIQAEERLRKMKEYIQTV